MSSEALEDVYSLESTSEVSGLDFIPGMLAVASIIDKVEEKIWLLEDVASILDTFIDRIKSPLYIKALEVIGYPLVDVFELVEALGVEGLEEVLSCADSVIRGDMREPPGTIRVYADLLGWSRNPEELEPRVLGYAIILSFTASFNKALNNLASLT